MSSLGTPSNLGNGTVASYAEFDKSGAPKAIGVVFSAGVRDAGGEVDHAVVVSVETTMPVRRRRRQAPLDLWRLRRPGHFLGGDG
jgi:hypothetical protein